MILLANDSVVVETSILNADLYKYLSNVPEYLQERELIKLVDIGLTVMSKITVSNTIDYVDKRIAEVFETFELRLRDLDKSFRDAVQPQVENLQSQTTLLLKSVQEFVLRETSKLESKLDPQNKLGFLSGLLSKIEHFEGEIDAQFRESDTNSFVNKLNTKISSHFGDTGNLTRLLDEKLQIDSFGKSPFSQLLLAVKGEINSLRDSVSMLMGRNQAIEATITKGAILEDIIFDKLQEIAKPFGDIVENVSLISEMVTRSKKGDFIYLSTDSNTRIVLDSKNYNKLTSLKQMLDYLDEAMAQREASIGLIVVADVDAMQKQIGEWNCYDSNKIITPVSFLEVSIKFAKYLSRFKSSSNQFSVPILKDSIAFIQRKTKELITIKAKLTKMNNGINSTIAELQTLVDEVRESINLKLNDLDKMLLSAEN